MKLLQLKTDQGISLGVKTDQGILDISRISNEQGESIPQSLQELIVQGEAGLTQLRDFVGKQESSAFQDEAVIQYAPAVTEPEKIICVGLNYVDHAEESKMDIPKQPILFSKFSNALAAHGDEVKIPEKTAQADYEAELVAIIGKTAQNVSVDEALDYVFGYTTGNDLSARDLQFVSGQWLLGKTCDGFAPVGPYVVTKDMIDPNHLNIECVVNGEVKQQSNTKHMIFNVATIISYISQHMTLKPGDIVFTGTPDGVILGYPEEERVWLKPGDEMVVTIEGIGSLRNVMK